jgi:hypothetical protein
MKRILYVLVWLAISLLAGLFASYFFKIGFWIAALIAGGALIANGLIAEWEDRRRNGKEL